MPKSTSYLVRTLNNLCRQRRFKKFFQWTFALKDLYILEFENFDSHYVRVKGIHFLNFWSKIIKIYSVFTWNSSSNILRNIVAKLTILEIAPGPWSRWDNGKVKICPFFSRFGIYFTYQTGQFFQRSIHPCVDLKLIWGYFT